MCTLLSPRTPCALCGSISEPVLKINDHVIYECVQCIHRMIEQRDVNSHVESIYGDSYFTDGGAGYNDYVGECDILWNQGRYYSKLLMKYIGRPGRLLDVGSAAGFILKGFVDQGWDGSGVEPNDTMAGYAREELGLDVCTNTIENYTSKNTVDFITMIQVVAHLINPKTVMQKCKSLLNPKAYVLLETWNYRSMTARILGSRWHEYSPPSVVHWFSRRSLDALMVGNGFELIATGHPKKYITAGHAKSLLKYQSEMKAYTMEHIINTMLKFVPDNFKMRYPSEDLFWSLYRLK